MEQMLRNKEQSASNLTSEQAWEQAYDQIPVRSGKILQNKSPSHSLSEAESE